MNSEQSYVVRRIYIVNNNCLVLINLNYSTACNVAIRKYLQKTFIYIFGNTFNNFIHRYLIYGDIE
jgi:hypothetical protein